MNMVKDDLITIPGISQHREKLMISGPCSAETEEQVMNTAESLTRLGIADILRAGIWKPRTKPGMFEGMGEQALDWIKRASITYKIPCAVEVANAKHVEYALNASVDVLWLGARTTVNPFSVQEIADALSGVKVPVLIKNPLSPDVELWSGAFERIQRANVLYTGLIHRGFSVFGNNGYRNPPLWQIPIEMQRRYPGAAMICDPSHISGKRSMLQAVAQTSMDLGFDGLMIETHPDPDRALSDAKQQITPENLLELIKSLRIRRKLKEKDLDVLMALRNDIDDIDDALMDLLQKRMKIADKIGVYKKEKNIAILQTKRWNQILDRALDKATALGLSRDFIYKYFDSLHMESIAHQKRIMNDSNERSDKDI